MSYLFTACERWQPFKNTEYWENVKIVKYLVEVYQGDIFHIVFHHTVYNLIESASINNEDVCGYLLEDTSIDPIEIICNIDKFQSLLRNVSKYHSYEKLITYGILVNGLKHRIRNCEVDFLSLSPRIRMIEKLEDPLADSFVNLRKRINRLLSPVPINN